MDAAYGDQKKYLEPMRTPWQGADGIAWLCTAEAAQLQSGAFYLDRKVQHSPPRRPRAPAPRALRFWLLQVQPSVPAHRASASAPRQCPRPLGSTALLAQPEPHRPRVSTSLAVRVVVSQRCHRARVPQVEPKHIAGPFFTEGSFTKNTPAEVDAMMQRLDDWSHGRRAAEADEAAALALRRPLAEMSAPIEVARFMGRWFVVAQIPTPFDRGAKNSVEDYAWNDVRAPPPPPSPMPPPSSSRLRSS